MAAEILSDLSRATDANSAPLSGAKWYFYASETLTEQPVYTTAALDTEHPHPVVADASGRFPAIYFDSALSYRGILKDASGATLPDMDIDPINAGILSTLAAPGGSALIGDFGQVVTTTDSAGAIADKFTAADDADEPVNIAGSVYSDPITTDGAGLRISGGSVGKSSNGVLLTHGGDYGRVINTAFSGLGYTGANLYLTGAETDLIFCDSNKGGSEALSSVGAVHLWGGVYESINADDAVPDIRIGQAGTATLYSSIIGVRTTQHEHGIYELNTGSTFRIGSQFGHLTIDGDAVYVDGTNGGHTGLCRITGNVICNVSTATFVGNLVASGYDVTFGALTSAISFGIASNQVGPTDNVNNLGNNASDICVNRGDGSLGFGGPVYAFGASGPSATGKGAELWVGVADSGGAPDPADGMIGTPGYFVGAYMKGYRLTNSSGGYFNGLSCASGSNVTLGSSAGYLDVVANSTGFTVTISATQQFKVTDTAVTVNTALLKNAANDAAAATAGTPVGGLYRNGSVLMVRIA